MKSLLRLAALSVVVFCLWPLSRVQGQNVSDFVEAEVDHATAYVGEPILYTWHVYLLSVSTINLDTQMRPLNFDGFGQEALEPTTESTIRDGQAYQVITQQIVLYPRREGTYTLDPVHILIPETPFAPARTLESTTIEVTIRPLPANTPTTFVDAVGQFNLEGQLDQQAVQTGMPLTFTMTINGSGNAPIISVPQLTLGTEWRAYPRGSRLRRDGALLGERTFTWQIVALQPGALTFPSQAWSYLNPLSGQYETRTTEPFVVTVTGDPIVEVQAVAEPTLYPLHYGLLSREAPLAPGSVWLDMHGPRTIYTQIMGDGMLLASVAPILAIGVCLMTFVTRRRGGGASPSPKAKRRSASREQLAALAQKPPQEIAVGVQTLVQEALSRKYAKPFSEDLIQGLAPEIRELARSCLESAKAAPYAPFTAEDARHLLRDVQRLIRLLEDQ